ncbi:hypothetical protein D3C73_958890 [compost metagenome]
MSRVGVLAGVPDQGDPDPCQREGQGQGHQIGVQGGAVPLGNRRHQVAAPHQGQGSGKAGDQGRRLACQSEVRQGLVYGALLQPAP